MHPADLIAAATANPQLIRPEEFCKNAVKILAGNYGTLLKDKKDLKLQVFRHIPVRVLAAISHSNKMFSKKEGLGYVCCLCWFLRRNATTDSDIARTAARLTAAAKTKFT